MLCPAVLPPLDVQRLARTRMSVLAFLIRRSHQQLPLLTHAVLGCIIPQLHTTVDLLPITTGCLLLSGSLCSVLLIVLAHHASFCCAADDWHEPELPHCAQPAGHAAVRQPASAELVDDGRRCSRLLPAGAAVHGFAPGPAAAAG